MKSAITSDIIVAYSQCPLKAFQLLCTNEQGTPHEYVRILDEKKRSVESEYIRTITQSHPSVQLYTEENLNKGSDFLINATLRANGFEAYCSILKKVEGGSSIGRYSYEPTIIVGTYSISKEQRIELAFVGHVLSQIQGKMPVAGRIIGTDKKSHKVKLGNSNEILLPLLEPLQEWRMALSPESPPLILNKHCSVCQFQRACSVEAEKEDNLSLLNGVTPKIMRQYEKKGIFTVRQLSYVFKQRKRKKQSRKRAPVTHKIELQALAIRERKIYLKEVPELIRQPVELFLDIEGIPDQKMYYLIGLLICKGNTSNHYFFWANTDQEEEKIWRQFFEKVSQFPKAPIYHYGSYEPKAIEKLIHRYDTDSTNLKNRMVNINSYIFGKVYFPIRSNQLKEIGNFIGARWTSPDASGLQSLVWRHYWEKTWDMDYRQKLITYNREDCEALKLLTDQLSQIEHTAHTLSEVDFVDHPKRNATEIGEQIHSQFGAILKFAHANYDKKKISFKQIRENENKEDKVQKKPGHKKGYQGQRKIRPKPTKVIKVPLEEFCPIHKSERLRLTDRIAKRLIIDLVLMSRGIKKTITEFVGIQGYCPKCVRFYSPPEIRKYGPTQLYGHGFKSWFVYQRVALQLPYEKAAEMMLEQFNERVSWGYTPAFLTDFGHYYAKTEQTIVRHLLESPFIHVDETPINIRGATQYAWVFTNGSYVIFKLSQTREATIAQELLADYDGVLISDFYAGYDSMNCRQQKCWVHLIRDLNNGLREVPFDTEFEAFVSDVRNLIIPIMEAVYRYGLKKHNLSKFRKNVAEFYDKTIANKRYRSELVLRFQKRFERYRESLFTFLEYDGISWHNNTAERANRHLAKQGAISGNFHESVTRDYLLLLGIRQTCRFQGKSFFRFLFSKDKDLDAFKPTRQR